MLLRANDRVIDSSHYHLGRFAPHFQGGQRHAGKRGIQVRRDAKIAEADDGEVFWDTQAECTTELVECKRQAVAGCQNGGRPVCGAQDRRQRRHIHGGIALYAPNIVRIGDKVGLDKRLAVA